MTHISVPVPRLDAGLLSNLLGLLGLLGLVIAPGGLTHNWWWSVVAGGVVAIALSYLISAQQGAAEAAGTERTARHLKAAQ